MDKQQLIQFLLDSIPVLSEKLADTITQNQLAMYSSVPRERLRDMTSSSMIAFIKDMLLDQPHFYLDYWSIATPQRAAAGAQPENVFSAIFFGISLLSNAAMQACGEDIALYNWWLGRVAYINNQAVILISRVFAAAREQVIRMQEARIHEISTPIIPLYHGILVLPLIGAIDSHRAGQVMERLLTGISEQQADVVIIDITGVPVVDTSVANYLLMATRAARLLGAKIILVGISAEVAQTIVRLGADLSGITTRANLQSGIELALAMQGLEIGPHNEPVMSR